MTTSKFTRTPFLSLAVGLLALSLFGETQPLWPEGKIPDFQKGMVAVPEEDMGKSGYKSEEHVMPYLDWCEAPAKPNGACLIFISGGGYFTTCDGPVMRKMAKDMVARGFVCTLLWYRTPRPKGLPMHQCAWEDGQRAVRLVRAAAKARGFDPEKIGVVGCSAGSHLAVLLGVSSQTPAYAKVDATDDLPCHVNWAIPFCPAYVLSDGIGTPNAKKGIGPDVTIDPCFKFDEKSCPMCLLHGGADEYSPTASTQIYRRLRKRGVRAEVHIDGGRPHGFYNLGARTERALEFINQMGFLAKPAAEVKLMDRFPDDSARGGYEKQNVWPKGKMPESRQAQCTPYLEWHLPKELKTKAIQIIFSGGCYQGNSPDGFEVAPARRYLNAKGMTVVTLKYRTPRPLNMKKHVTAWQDLQRTIRIVRSQAAAKGLDPDRIGIMGSSAGGHLVLMGATSARTEAYRPIDELDKLSCKANWAVAIYPAYALTDGLEAPNRTGGNDDSAVLAPEFAFDADTCPICFIHGDSDGWTAMNSVKCWEKLREMGIQGDLHTLALRDHCFQRQASPGTGSYTWLDRIWDFMSDRKYNR